MLCDRTLLAGYAAGEPRIGAGLVRQAARELPDAERRGAGIAWLRRPWVSVSAAGAVAAFVVGLLLSEQLVLTQASTPVLPHVASPAPVDEEQPDEKAVWVSMEIPISELEPETTSIAPEVVPPMLASATAKASPPSDVLDASAGVEMLTVDEDEHQGEFLARLLAEQQPEHAEELAVNAILERFGLPILVAAAARSEDRLAGLTRQHLSLAPLDDANMALLRRLDYPALIELLAEDGVLRLVALLGVDGEMVELMGAHGRESLHVPARAVDELMTGAATVVWRDYELTSPLLSMGDRGIAVRWLQQSMVDLGDDRLDVNGYYDLPTAEAVRRYQRKRRLRDDGIAGPLTQMLIYGDLDGYAPPRLSAGAGRRGGGAG